MEPAPLADAGHISLKEIGFLTLAKLVLIARTPLVGGFSLQPQECEIKDQLKIYKCHKSGS